MKKKLFTRVLLALVVITIIGTTIAYFSLHTDKPWLAFFVAFCGGVLVVNFLVSLYLVWKNFK